MNSNYDGLGIRRGVGVLVRGWLWSVGLRRGRGTPRKYQEEVIRQDMSDH